MDVVNHTLGDFEIGDDAMSEQGDKAAVLGHPSYVWRFGQQRRLALMDQYVSLHQKRILDVGCGIGTYVEKLGQFSDQVYGVDIDQQRVREGGKKLPNLLAAAAQALPFGSGCFDVLLLHEVLEHVQDDRQVVQEAYRVLRPGGRMIIFAPNRLYPFETHGIYWRGRYRFGNFPLVNYLPRRLRERLCPHVRAYTPMDLRRLLPKLDHRIIVLKQIYPGYDNIFSRRPWLGAALRRLTYLLESTPLRIFGLSHFLVLERGQETR